MERQISCEFNIDTACVEVKHADGSMISIDCTKVKNEIARNMYEASELDWLVYKASGDLNNPKQKGGLPSINIPFAYPHLYLENLILPGGIKTCEPQKETREQFRYSAVRH